MLFLTYIYISKKKQKKRYKKRHKNMFFSYTVIREELSTGMAYIREGRSRKSNVFELLILTYIIATN